MIKRISWILVLTLVLSTGLLVGCGACKHNYQERDGRVVCLDCKNVCEHSYEIDGSNAYCSNCLFSCKHNFVENNGEMVCDSCSITCTHEFNEDSVCKHCETKCNHEFATDGTNTKCKICNRECEHNFEESDGKMVCKVCKKTCAHEFGKVDGSYKCKYCGTACKHDYKESSGKRTCKKCGYSKVVLTIDNVNDYFTVNVKVYDVVVEEDWIDTKDNGKGKADISISSKQNVKYKNVVLTIRLVSTFDEWMNRITDVELSYDGTGQKTISFSSMLDTFVPSNPSFKPVITAVKGEIDG